MNILKKVKNNYILLAILVFAAILRFYHIDFQSIWLDEIHTMNESNPEKGFFELYDIIVSGEQMPPFYFYSVYFLFKIFGYSTLVVRLYSAMIGVLGVLGVFLLGREMFNRKTGLVAAALLAVNYFHLYYSQEARPYIFLFLFTTLSFYTLLRYIKKPGIKQAIVYGIMCALMIWSHFFGLLTLFAQYALLGLLLIFCKKENRTRIFLNSLLSGLITIILFIPAIKILVNVAAIKEFWIPKPTLDVYTLIFREFFGNSEIILAFLGVFSMLYFIRLFNEKDTPLTYEGIVGNRNIFGFIILAIWISVVLLIPLVKSYLSIPMIISRYFISVLPAIILIIAVGISEFRNKIVSTGIIIMYVVFSLIDITVVKKYYHSVNKSQFREATAFLANNNKNKEPVVSSLSWYMTYFLKNDRNNFEITGGTLDSYVAAMQNDPSKIKPFWYIDGHNITYTENPVTLEFLNKNFYIENNYDGFQAWTKHFILLKDVPATLDISKYIPLQQKNGNDFVYNLDAFEYANGTVKVNGWAYFENFDADQTKIAVVLIKDGIATRVPSQKVSRPDVTNGSRKNFNLDNSGFAVVYDVNGLNPGKYQLGIYLKNAETKKEGLILTDRSVDK